VVSALRVTGIVAAVLAVLTVLAITSRAPRRNATGDRPRRTSIVTRYQATWHTRPTTTTTISQIKDWKPRTPSFRPTTDATTPNTASGTRATTQRSTRMSSSNPRVSKSTAAW